MMAGDKELIQARIDKNRETINKILHSNMSPVEMSISIKVLEEANNKLIEKLNGYGK